MKLGTFSISLNVSDIAISKEFYEKLGFYAIAGDIKADYLIMKNGTCIIGLFQDMFASNILTFNTGWDDAGNKLDAFDDIRLIQKQLQQKGIEVGEEISGNTIGPASFVIYDPDGNEILFDQHV